MPRVSIGMPVYNGENYISAAIESVLNQTFRDLELVISDNCSEDNTQRICEEYAEKDTRVRYIRRTENNGAAPNFNSLVDECASEYFKWAAHDDLIAKNYVECCVRKLDKNPAAVLCYSGSQVIDTQGNPVLLYQNRLRFDQEDASERFAQLVQFHKTARYEIFGLFRRSFLLDSDLIGSFTDGDGVLLAHAGLRGQFEFSADTLFFPRRHEQQSQRLIKNKAEYDEWFDSRNKGAISLPHFRILREYARVVANEPLSGLVKARCYRSIVSQGFRIWRLLRGDIRRALPQLAKRLF